MRSHQGIQSANGWFQLLLEDDGTLLLKAADTPIVLWKCPAKQKLRWRRIRDDRTLVVAGGHETIVLLNNDGNLVHLSPETHVAIDDNQLGTTEQLMLWESGTSVCDKDGHGPYRTVRLSIVIDFGPRCSFFVMNPESDELADAHVENGSGHTITVKAGGDTAVYGSAIENRVIRLKLSGRTTPIVTRVYDKLRRRYKVNVPQPEITLYDSVWPTEYLFPSTCQITLREENSDFFYREPGQQQFLDRFWTTPDAIALPETAFMAFGLRSHFLSRFLGGFRSTTRQRVQACEMFAVPEDDAGLGGIVGKGIVRDTSKRGFCCSVPITFVSFVWSMARFIRTQDAFENPPNPESFNPADFCPAFKAMLDNCECEMDHPVIRALWCRSLNATSDDVGTFERLRGFRLLNSIGECSSPLELRGKSISQRFPYRVLDYVTYFVFQHEFAHYDFPHNEARNLLVDSTDTTSAAMKYVEEMFCDSFAAKSLMKYWRLVYTNETFLQDLEELFTAIVLSYAPVVQGYASDDEYPHPLNRLEHVLLYEIPTSLRSMGFARIDEALESIRSRVTHALLAASDLVAPLLTSPPCTDPFRALAFLVNFRGNIPDVPSSDVQQETLDNYGVLLNQLQHSLYNSSNNSHIELSPQNSFIQAIELQSPSTNWRWRWRLSTPANRTFAIYWKISTAADIAIGATPDLIVQTIVDDGSGNAVLEFSLHTNEKNEFFASTTIENEIKSTTSTGRTPWRSPICITEMFVAGRDRVSHSEWDTPLVLLSMKRSVYPTHSHPEDPLTNVVDELALWIEVSE